MTDTIPSRLLKQAQTRPDAPAYFVRESSGVWQSTSWSGYASEVTQAGRALIALGLEGNFKTSILGFNRPEWVVLNMATMAVGGACAGIYTTCSSEEVAYIVNHCEAPLVLVENESQWAKINAEKANLPHLKHVVMMKDGPTIDDALVMSWEEFLAQGDKIDEKEFHARMDALEPDGLATLIYTSGTTGPPKAVMLNHHNLAWTASTAVRIIGATSDDSTVSYLPLSHIAEQMFSVHGPTTAGFPIYFAESIDNLLDNLKEVQPTIFFGVPRIWEKFHTGIATKLEAATGIKAKLAKWAMQVGRDANLSPNGKKGLAYKIANKLIYTKLKPAVGLGRAKFCVSGAAPISAEVLEFFASLDVMVLEVYGQSEDCGPTTFNMPDNYRLGSVGAKIDGIDVKIADDGEILVKGPNVFQGYYKDEAATAETLTDGWLHSGDLGEFKDGFLNITGRKKDIIITAGGKNVAPKNLEADLKNHPLINEAVIIGDRRKYLTALITLDEELLEPWSKEHKLNMDGIHEDPTLLADLQKCVDNMNTKYARVEQVKKFKVLTRNFSIEEGELTPTLKVKRQQVNEHFADTIEALYAD